MGLSNQLLSGSNYVLNTIDDPSLSEKISEKFNEHLKNITNPRVKKLYLKYIIKKFDYRLAAEYLWSYKNDSKRFRIISKLIKNTSNKETGQVLSKLAVHRFNYNFAKVVKNSSVQVNSLSDLYVHKKGISKIYYFDHNYSKILNTLEGQIKGNWEKYIQSQLDLPGRNAVIRQGLIKKWEMPNGTTVISKKQNPRKKERFLNELKNYKLLTSLFKKEVELLSQKNKIKLQLSKPIAAISDGTSGNRYIIFEKSKGVSLDEILIGEKDKKVRKYLLNSYKLILETLYSMGILWGDISPRNILVQKNKNFTVYTLIDFEKSKIYNHPVDKNKRYEHWRGQMFIEELAIICSKHEIINNFRKYYNPDEWDLKSNKKIDFELRPDVIDILNGRKIKNIKIGDYNKLDQKIFDIKVCSTNPKGEVYYPGYIGFKIEHYLSCLGYKNASDYDRKNTEVLLAAFSFHLTEGVVKLLNSLTSSLESNLVLSEFNSILNTGSPSKLITQKGLIKKITNLLDELYDNRKNKKILLDIINNFKI